MRIRTIKPEFWTDGFIVSLPHFARLLYVAIWSVADDHGYIADEPDRIAMQIFPKENLSDVWGWIDFFVASDRLELHVTETGSTFFRVAKWEKHQRVDKPGKSRIATEPSRKLAIPTGTRRAVATKYKCEPGRTKDAECYYCGSSGKIHWHTLSSGKPSVWVSFSELELDHIVSELTRGTASTDNIVLACRSCNRSKGTKDWLAFFSSQSLASIPEKLRSPREDSGTEQGTGNREQGTGNSFGEKSPKEFQLTEESPKKEPAPAGLTDTQKRLGGLFGRRDSTPWSKAEAKALKGIPEISEADWQKLEAFYRTNFPHGQDFRKRKLSTFLNDFHGAMDMARNHKPATVW